MPDAPTVILFGLAVIASVLVVSLFLLLCLVAKGSAFEFTVEFCRPQFGSTGPAASFERQRVFGHNRSAVPGPPPVPTAKVRPRNQGGPGRGE